MNSVSSKMYKCVRKPFAFLKLTPHTIRSVFVRSWRCVHSAAQHYAWIPRMRPWCTLRHMGLRRGSRGRWAVRSGYDAHLTPIGICVKVRDELGSDVHQSTVFVLLEERRWKRVGPEGKTAAGPVGTTKLREKWEMKHSILVRNTICARSPPNDNLHLNSLHFRCLLIGKI